MIFKDAKEMHEYLMNSGDLYNKRTGHYVFEYNDAHAICVYSIPSYDEMLKTAKKALKQDESLISAVLGEGGVIYDDYSHDGYSEDENERALYLKPTMGYCHSYFTSQNWIDVREFFTHIQIEEIENLSENAQDGTDADTILADAVNNCEREFTGFAQDIFNIWKESSDKKPTISSFSAYKNILRSAVPLSASRVSSSLLAAFENILIPQKLSLYNKYAANNSALSTYGSLTGMIMPLIHFPSSLLNAVSINLVPAISKQRKSNNKSLANNTIKRSLTFG